MEVDKIINKVLADSEEQLHNAFWGTFGEEMEAERMLEFMATMQIYAGNCMRAALAQASK